VQATKLYWLLLMKGWTLSRPIDVGLGSMTMTSWLFQIGSDTQKNLANSWVKLGLYLKEGPGGKDLMPRNVGWENQDRVGLNSVECRLLGSVR
jgi:hypothetical protein